jgi:hypothetical protein
MKKLLLAGKVIIKDNFFIDMANFAKLLYNERVFKKISKSEKESLKDAKEILNDLKKFKRRTNTHLAQLVLKITRRANHMLAKKDKIEVIPYLKLEHD